MNDDELRLRLFNLAMEYIDEPFDQRLHHVLSIVEVAEGMDLAESEVERQAEAGTIPGGYKDADGSWAFLVEAIIWFLAGPVPPEVQAEIRAALEARPIGERVRRKWTLEDVAHVLHLPPDEVRRLAAQEILTGHRGPNGVWTFSYDDVMAYVARRDRA